jgi:hypothetical protein
VLKEKQQNIITDNKTQKKNVFHRRNSKGHFQPTLMLLPFQSLTNQGHQP